MKTTKTREERAQSLKNYSFIKYDQHMKAPFATNHQDGHRDQMDVNVSASDPFRLEIHYHDA